MNPFKTSTQPPFIEKKSKTFKEFDQERVDPYFWLREKENPAVIQLLNEENTYLDSTLAPFSKLRNEIFEELKARLETEENGVPEIEGPFEYFWQIPEGKQYRSYHRRFRADATASTSSSGGHETLLDLNAEAMDGSFLSLNTFDVSPAHDWLAYSLDRDGSEHYTLRFKNLKAGSISPEEILHTSSGFAWADDGKTVFYIRLNDKDRPFQVWRHQVGTDPKQDRVVFEEKDDRFFVGVSNSKSREFIFIDTSGKITSETYFLSAKTPHDPFRVIEPRRDGIEYSVEHHEKSFIILTNDAEKNFRAVIAPVTAPQASNWIELRRGSKTLFIEHFEVFKDYWVFYELLKGLPTLSVMSPAEKKILYTVDFDEPAYALDVHGNREFDSQLLRFTYSSLKTPDSTFDYNLKEKTRVLRKQLKIPSGFDGTQYEVKRILCPSHDGIEVPLSLIWKKGNPFPSPTLLYGYGSYGYPLPAGFSRNIFSLLDRGFVYAMAHIRGGADLGRHWYDDGKFLKKKNTFKDFIACAEKLIQDGMTTEGDISIMGGSAGGMLVGATMNMRPELFKSVIGRVPFVDVINTMLDDTLPLTPTEYDEWGNPSDKLFYDYMLSYSPYDNVTTKAYPHVLFTAGLNDPRVTYWEPMKMVARLRELKTDDNKVLLFTEMGAGHGGASGRFDRLKENAMIYTFIIAAHGRAHQATRGAADQMHY